MSQKVVSTTGLAKSAKNSIILQQGTKREQNFETGEKMVIKLWN